MSDLAATMDWAKGGGLVPLVVQHAHDGRVLMLGYTNRAALEETLATGEVHFWSRSRQRIWRKGETSGHLLALVSLATGEVHFWSRSRQRIWRKGETSGHVLALASLAADCDGDALLCQAVPQGPTCHRGTASCFDGDAPAHPWLNELEALIDVRGSADPATSYVARLLAAPQARRGQKVGEEGVEVAIAAASGSDEALVGEAADLVFHLLVLLRGRGLALADVVGELARRHGRSSVAAVDVGA